VSTTTKLDGAVVGVLLLAGVMMATDIGPRDERTVILSAVWDQGEATVSWQVGSKSDTKHVRTTLYQVTAHGRPGDKAAITVAPELKQHNTDCTIAPDNAPSVTEHGGPLGCHLQVILH
jgi:hypothetical protein